MLKLETEIQIFKYFQEMATVLFSLPCGIDL